jgi:acetyl-CoA C-acetyltransferase
MRGNLRAIAAMMGITRVEDIVIAASARTAVGAFSAAFADVSAHELGAAAVKAASEH